jgi:hypothetical protein
MGTLLRSVPAGEGHVSHKNMKETDLIWNRACEGGGANPRNGDRALEALLKAHGLTMNGGVLHAVECLDAIKFADAKSGYCFFGLDSVADLMTRARLIFEAGQNLETHESKLDQEYATLIPDDSALCARFEEHYKMKSSDFAPV